MRVSDLSTDALSGLAVVLERVAEDPGVLDRMARPNYHEVLA